MPVTHGVASSSLVQTANPNRESLSPTGWGTFAFYKSLDGVALLDVDEGRLVLAGGVERAAPAEALIGIGAQDLKDADARF